MTSLVMSAQRWGGAGWEQERWVDEEGGIERESADDAGCWKKDPATVV